MLRWICGLALALLTLGGFLHRWLSSPAFEADLTLPVEAARAEVSLAPPRLARDVLVPPKNEPPLPIEVKRSGTPALSKTRNILLVGIDRRPGQKYGGRPDTIVVAALSEEDGHLGLISIPRDLYVDIPGHGKDRVNATFSVAWNRKEKSLELLERVLEDTLKLPIAHTVALDLGGFEELIDVLGGVEVDVPCPISDNFIDSRSPTGRVPLQVDAGRQQLDGKTAALYVRSRHGRSDWSRARRQQAVLFGIKRKFQTGQGLTRLPEFFEKLRPLIQSDMSRAEVLELARAASSLEPQNVHGLVLGVKQAQPHYTEEGKAVLVPHFEEIDRALSQLFAADLPGTRPALAPCPAEDVALQKRGAPVQAPRIKPLRAEADARD